MRWDLVGYSRHPVDGDPDAVASLATHLGSVADSIRGQIDQLAGCGVDEIWESSAGSADSFIEVTEPLPEKLDLVATRYERVAAALDAYHPVMASTRQDCEYWVQQAEEAQSEVERAQSGIELMEDFARQAELDAEAANEDLEPGDPEVEPDEWQGEDYHATLAQAEADLESAINNCRAAAEEFAQAHARAVDEVHDAGDDDLKNDDSLWGSFTSWASDAWDAVLDVVEVVVQVLEIIGPIVALIACLLIPGLGFAMAAFIVAAVVFAGNVLLAADGRRSWTQVAIAGVNCAAAGLGVAAAGPGASAALQWTNRAVGAGTGFLGTDSAGNFEWNITGGLLSTGAVGLDVGLNRGNLQITDDLLGSDIVGEPSLFNANPLNGFGYNDAFNVGGSYANLGTSDPSLFSPQSQQRPEIDLSGIRFDGLDVAVSPADMEVPQIDLPDMGPLEIPPVDPGSAPDICSTVEVNVPGLS